MRPPDLIIGPLDAPQTLRWDLLQWRGIQVALHRWVNSDSDRALHDHSAGNISILLTGFYREWFSHRWEAPRYKLRLPFVPYFRSAEVAHRVELIHGPVWTLWIRFKQERQWGFWCSPSRWVYWKDYVRNRDNVSEVGNGCG
jgi:hypothetical protein